MALSTPVRRFLARAAVIFTLVAVPIAAAGCGAGAHLAGSVIAHKIANHLAPGHKRLINKAFCLYDVDRAFKNARHHHLIYGAASIALAIRDCEAGFSKNAR